MEVEVREEGEGFEHNGEEARVARGRRAPRGPTQMERESHELTRLPYRAWRGHCVRGCGEKTPHRTRGGSEEETRHMAPRMVLSDHFMSTCDAGNGKNPALAMEGRVGGKSRYESSRK